MNLLVYASIDHHLKNQSNSFQILIALLCSIALLELLQKHIAHCDHFVTNSKKWLDEDKLHHHLPLDLFGFMILYGL